MKRSPWVVAIALTGACMLTTTTPAHAQLGTTFFAVGEFDTNDVVLGLAGLSISRTGLGWSPVAGLQGFWLQYPQNGVTQDLISVTPSLGLKNTFNGGSAEFRVGYTFQDADSEELPTGGVIVADTEDGVTTTAQVEYWGTGQLGAQFIANYNWGGETLWTRGRVTHRIMNMGTDGHIRIGAEAAYLYKSVYDALQVGGLVGIMPGRHVVLNLGAGRKIDSVNGATYFKVELVVIP